MEAVLAWAREVGQGLDELTPEQRREILQMIVEQIVIDRDNNVDITLAIPIDEDSPESDSVAIASESSSFQCPTTASFWGKKRMRYR